MASVARSFQPIIWGRAIHICQTASSHQLHRWSLAMLAKNFSVVAVAKQDKKETHRQRSMISSKAFRSSMYSDTWISLQIRLALRSLHSSRRPIKVNLPTHRKDLCEQVKMLRLLWCSLHNKDSMRVMLSNQYSQQPQANLDTLRSKPLQIDNHPYHRHLSLTM